MRVVVAVDSFGGTMTAPEAADAIAAGWRATNGRDELDLAPVSDGGPGFVDVLAAALDATAV
ncbi:MAG TPA: glycerate kinase, partial [Mycobacteriales bacterium]|nr:glycerate kinase [Mycobacteriales bacterium]